MQNRFADMDCYILAGKEKRRETDSANTEDMTQIEKGYRRYAKLFEKVKLVLNKEQAKGHFLNYPHICDDENNSGVVAGIKTALQSSKSEAIFIGSSEIGDFSLELVVDLVRKYDGELFLGYQDGNDNKGCSQPLFGVFSKKLADHLTDPEQTLSELSELLASEGRLLPLPVGVSQAELNCI